MTEREALIKKIIHYGKEYKSAVLPENLKLHRGKVGDCYDTSILCAFRNPTMTYVEGIAKNPDTKEWVLHAWVTDGEYAYDLTWKAVKAPENVEVPIPTNYIGIEIPTRSMLDFLRSTGYKSILSNGWRDKDLARKILGFEVW